MTQQPAPAFLIVHGKHVAVRTAAEPQRDITEYLRVQRAVLISRHTVRSRRIKSRADTVFRHYKTVLRLVAAAARFRGAVRIADIQHRQHIYAVKPRFAELSLDRGSFQLQLALVFQKPVSAPSAACRSRAERLRLTFGRGHEHLLKARDTIAFCDLDDLCAHTVSRHGTGNEHDHSRVRLSGRHSCHTVAEVRHSADLKLNYIVFKHQT